MVMVSAIIACAIELKAALSLSEPLGSMQRPKAELG